MYVFGMFPSGDAFVKHEVNVGALFLKFPRCVDKRIRLLSIGLCCLALLNPEHVDSKPKSTEMRLQSTLDRLDTLLRIAGCRYDEIPLHSPALNSKSRWSGAPRPILIYSQPAPCARGSLQGNSARIRSSRPIHRINRQMFSGDARSLR